MVSPLSFLCVISGVDKYCKYGKIHIYTSEFVLNRNALSSTIFFHADEKSVTIQVTIHTRQLGGNKHIATSPSDKQRKFQCVSLYPLMDGVSLLHSQYPHLI